MADILSRMDRLPVENIAFGQTTSAVLMAVRLGIKSLTMGDSRLIQALMYLRKY